MIQQAEDGSTIYYKDIMRNPELYIGLFMLITIVLVIPAIWLLSRAYHPKQICTVGRDYISWDDYKLFFKDIVYFQVAKKYFLVRPRLRTILTFTLRTNKKSCDLNDFHYLTTTEKQHLLRTLRKLGLKQKRNKFFAEQPTTLQTWQNIQEQQFLEKEDEI